MTVLYPCSVYTSSCYPSSSLSNLECCVLCVAVSFLFYNIWSLVLSEQLQTHIQCQRRSWLVCCCYSSGGLYLCIIHSGNEQCTSSVPCTSSTDYPPPWCDRSNICGNHSCRWLLYYRWKHLPTTNHCKEWRR